MADYGAEPSLIYECDRDFLSRTSEFAGLTAVGIGGEVGEAAWGLQLGADYRYALRPI